MKNRYVICCALTLLVPACTDQPFFRPRGEVPTDSQATQAKASGPRAPKSKTSAAKPAAESDPTPLPELLGIPFGTADSVGPLVVGSRYFTVLLHREKSGGEEHVRFLQLRDETGVVHYEESFDPPLQDNQPAWTMTVSAHALRGEQGQGVVVYYQRLPSAPHSGLSLRIFSLQGSRLVPLASGLSVHGTFGELLESRESGVLFLLPGERIDVEVWTGYFGISVPYRVQLSGCKPGSEQCIRPAVRRGDIVPGLSLLSVNAPNRQISASGNVQLFDAPEGVALRRVPVSRRSDVTIIQVAADVYTENENGVAVIRTRREWLHVRIDGSEGWIHGDESFRAIGFKASS
jgi:hypothetical protein